MPPPCALLFVAFCCKVCHALDVVKGNKPVDLLRDAESAPSRESLMDHKEAIAVLRRKNYTWREISQFLAERGIDADHTRIFRFMKQQGASAMESFSFAVPSSELYKEALSAIEPEISDTQRAMLQHHYRAHNRTATFTQLAKAAGSENYRTANSQYGKLGERIGKQIGMTFSTYMSKGKSVPFFSSAIGSGSHFREEDTGHFQLIMHHELAKALEQLGWFEG
jgi:hypothetical protein